MGVYLVTWNLNRENANHDVTRAAFIERLEEYDYVHDEDLESVYFVSTPLSAGQVSTDLHTKLDTHDKVIVAQVMEGTYCGWMPQPLWDWIEERL